MARGQFPPAWLSEDGQWVALVLSKGTLTPTCGGVFHEPEAGRKSIRRQRAAGPHQPLPICPERKVHALPALQPPPPQPPVAAPMMWDGVAAPSHAQQMQNMQHLRETSAYLESLVASSLHALQSDQDTTHVSSYYCRLTELLPALRALKADSGKVPHPPPPLYPPGRHHHGSHHYLFPSPSPLPP
jgi:hypothetical protein